MFVGYVWPFLIYALILYVVCYIVVEYGQYYLYDEVTPGTPLKVLLGAVILAAILTKTRSNFATMFTSDIASTVVLAIAWSGVFILIYRFQPWHGFGLAMATLLLFAGIATLVVDSMLTPRPTERFDTTKEYKPVRRPTGGVVVPPPAQAKGAATPPAPAAK